MKKMKQCANYRSGDSIHPFAAKTTGINCKDCVYFSPKNCGANAGAAVYRDMA